MNRNRDTLDEEFRMVSLNVSDDVPKVGIKDHLMRVKREENLREEIVKKFQEIGKRISGHLDI